MLSLSMKNMDIPQNNDIIKTKYETYGFIFSRYFSKSGAFEKVPKRSRYFSKSGAFEKVPKRSRYFSKSGAFEKVPKRVATSQKAERLRKWKLYRQLKKSLGDQNEQQNRTVN